MGMGEIDSYSGRFLHTLSASVLGPEESSAIPTGLCTRVFDMAVPVSNRTHANKTHAFRTALAFYKTHVALADLTQ